MDRGHSSTSLAERVKRWGLEAGFDAVAIAGIDLAQEEARLLEWLGRGWHGAMDYMARHGTRRSRPAELVPGTACVISALCSPSSASSMARALPTASSSAS